MKITVGNTFRAEALAAANRERERRLAAFDRFTYDGKLFDGDPAAQDGISVAARAARAAVALPAGFTWRAFDNSDVPMTNDGIVELEAAMLAALSAHRFQVHESARALKAQIIDATSAAQVDALAWPDQSRELP